MNIIELKMAGGENLLGIINHGLLLWEWWIEFFHEMLKRE